jgi:hypothetical protein
MLAGKVQGRDRGGSRDFDRVVRCCAPDSTSSARHARRSSALGLLMVAFSTISANWMTPDIQTQKGVRYRYYISTVPESGTAEDRQHGARPADLIERLVPGRSKAPRSTNRSGGKGQTDSSMPTTVPSSKRVRSSSHDDPHCSGSRPSRTRARGTAQHLRSRFPFHS